MRIKKFIGASFRDVTDQMKREFGDDAIILQSRSRKIGSGDPCDADTTELYEITAAIDGMMPEARENLMPAPENSTFESALNAFANQSAGGKSPHTEDLLNGCADRLPARSEIEGLKRQHSGTAQPAGRQTDVEEIGRDLADLRATLNDVSEHLKIAKIPSLPAALRSAYEKLIENEVDEKIAAGIVHAVRAEIDEYLQGNDAAVEKAVLARIASSLNTGITTLTGRKRPHVVALVGPTGVGKTTTIAKLSAIEKLMHHHSVALISFDTFRIGAVEQLQMFAEITELPMEVASAPAEVKGLLQKFAERDIVFIDTVGRSQRRDKELRELNGMVAAAEPDEVHLVLSSTANTKTMAEVVARFGVLHPTSLIFSKLDEAVTTGPVLNIARTVPLPISYVTTGQTVPYDILEADPAQLAGMIWEGTLAHV